MYSKEFDFKEIVWTTIDNLDCKTRVNGAVVAMADENNEDDSWLYGSSSENPENPNKSTDPADSTQDTIDSSQDIGQENVSYLPPYK